MEVEAAKAIGAGLATLGMIVALRARQVPVPPQE